MLLSLHLCTIQDLLLCRAEWQLSAIYDEKRDLNVFADMARQVIAEVNDELACRNSLLLTDEPDVPTNKEVEAGILAQLLDREEEMVRNYGT